MKVLVTGSKGYIGSVLTPLLMSLNYEVDGLDIGYFEEPLVPIENEGTRQFHPVDIRYLQDFSLKNYDAVVHLAALSNDPVSELDSELTIDVNREAAIDLAHRAKEAGVSTFVFISTQSIYGISASDQELDEDAPKNPQTAYAETKWAAEQAILAMNSASFTTVALRPSTVFGWSPRLRSDIVFNNLLLSGLQTGEIQVHSDGTPWRPIIHVVDLCRAIQTVLDASKKLIGGEAFNIGNLNGNFQVHEIAKAASECLGNVPIRMRTEDIKDPRSYRVSFRKAEKILGFKASAELETAGNEILRMISKSNLAKSEYLGPRTNRLARIKDLVSEGLLDSKLRFN